MQRRTGAPGGHVDRRTSGRGRARWADERTKADTGQTGRQLRTGGRRISEGKTPNLMRQLIWPSEIQRGRPRVTVKLPHLPPPSR